MHDLVPFLMFCGEQHGKAGEAVEWYCSLFEDSRIVSLERYGADEGEPEGSVRLAVFELGGHKMMAIDSAGPHQFTFTPAISIWIDCESNDELEDLAKALVAGGEALMPLDDYGFSQRFAWIKDPYGVTWQLNLPH
jgi:predicted 3-demethylubiquinone-9 3-methyltransferase (glyoxalase superfamily)